MPITVERVTLRNGVRLDYAEAGDAFAPPVLLLHGFSDSWRSFEAVLPLLPRRLRALAPSFRGHGGSDRPEGGYGPGDLAADIAAFMDALGLPAAVVVGHSMGGSVALRLAIEHPGRVAGLMLVGARASWRGHPEVEALAGLLDAMRDRVDRAFVRAFQESTIASPVPPGLLDTVVAESLRVPARVWRAAMREGVLGADDRDRLGRVAAPTLLLCGDRDGLAWDGQAVLAAGIGGARQVTYAGTGHALHWEQPARFAADLAAFAEGRAGAEMLSP
jgi:non-heme chloroperoxidase